MSETIIQSIEAEAVKIKDEILGFFHAEEPVVFTEFETVYASLKAKAVSATKLALDSSELATLKADITAEATVLKTKLEALLAAL